MAKPPAATTSRFFAMIAFVCFLAGLAWMTEPWNWFSGGAAPSEASLRVAFPLKRGQLQKLVAMIYEDKDVSCVSDKEVSCKKGTFTKYDGKWSRLDWSFYPGTYENDIEEEYVLVSSNLTYPRYQEYLRLQNQAGVRNVKKDQEAHVEFLVWSNRKGHDKGWHEIRYVFCPRDHVGDKLDRRNGHNDETWTFIKLEPNWYVEHRYADSENTNWFKF